ncbi:S41 family peptidase [Candidatus Soleaferrea massiliensis]|uniref:S41 family peptidase n=1 Tax=Candidatus Soleaferrea massiliensis TaxID=1470354 RepID=UPI0006937645|nr:S41 family peptidase [Candidatus Soleaferrea massiliensis]
MNKKISLGAALSAIIITIAVTFSITMVFSMQSFNEKVLSLEERENMYTKVAEVDRLVRQNYIGTIDEEYLNDEIADGYIRGTGDTYGTYLTAKQYKQLMDSYTGKMVGIGIGSEKDASGYIKVKQVYDESPAESAGLKEGDLIVKVDDLDITTNNYSDAIDKLSGEAGTKVTIVIHRDTQEITTEITRRQFEIRTVESKMIGDQNGYIKITEFNDSTTTQFQDALDELADQGAQSLIFDVRGNPGGTINSVADILDILLPEGTIVSATYKNGKTEVLKESDADEVELPMVVITNEKSASAAELFTQALKDYDKAKSVGAKTFGKGSMQTVFQLSDGSALDLTVAKYNPPMSDNFDGIGVKPDYEVQLPADVLSGEVALAEANDSQLQKALEVIEIAKKEFANKQQQGGGEESSAGVLSGASEEQSAASEETPAASKSSAKLSLAESAGMLPEAYRNWLNRF